MEKLPMCRICLAKNVPMCVVVNKNLHELYKKLTDVPFVTEDSRPMVACSICCVKLKQCCRLMMKCLEAEQRFAKMTNEDHERNLFVKQDHLQFFGGLVKTSLESISIVDVGLTECVIVKEELPAVCEGQDDIIEQTEEHLRDDIKQENPDIGYSDEEDISFPSIKLEEDSEDDVPLMEFKTEVEEDQEVSEQKQRAVETNNLELENLEYSRLDEEYVLPVLPHGSDSDSEDDVPLVEFKIEVEEEHETPKEKRRAVDTTRPTVAEEPKLHLRRTKLEDSIPANKKRNQISDSEIIGITQNRTAKLITKFKMLHECDTCQRSFSQKAHLTDHIRTHTGVKPHKCDTCQRSFSQKPRSDHIRTHTGEKPFKCNICHSSFSQKVTLINHSRTHTGVKPYKCDICQRSFSQKYPLTSHIRTHTGVKPYKCEICQRSFSQKVSLTIHIRTHTGVKPYKCNICQSSFGAKGTLTKHIRTHTGEKPYKCEICQSSFSLKGSLTNHIRTHTGVKPYKCNVCQRSFSAKISLTAHMRTHTV